MPLPYMIILISFYPLSTIKKIENQSLIAKELITIINLLDYKNIL